MPDAPCAPRSDDLVLVKPPGKMIAAVDGASMVKTTLVSVSGVSVRVSNVAVEVAS